MDASWAASGAAAASGVAAAARAAMATGAGAASGTSSEPCSEPAVTTSEHRGQSTLGLGKVKQHLLDRAVRAFHRCLSAHDATPSFLEQYPKSGFSGAFSSSVLPLCRHGALHQYEPRRPVVPPAQAGLLEDGRFAVLVLVVARVLCVPCHELLDMGVAGTHGTAVLEVLLLNFFGARHLVAVNHI